MDKIIKLILVVILLGCLLKMPYSYYQFVRTIGLVGFSYLAYIEYTKKNNILVLLYVGLAILFQPVEKIILGRELWNIVDVIVAVWLIATIAYELLKSKREMN